MTPIEKAREIIKKVSPHCHGGKDTKLERENAKRVSEMLCDEFLTYFPEEQFQQYWKQVKSEIEKL